MGVPKFYRWLSERYPLINQLISDGKVLPEFDNLYLDMNGIIHSCTHPSDNDMAATLTYREMILGIFRYIERAVNVTVKPKKVLFIAVDGVAPRAKLNQQRSRRFRAAQDRVESIEKARQKGEKVDEDSIFDSNCITPGTEFMEMVGKHLRLFIRKKVKEDPQWRDLEVIFSGHDVPGEGEHKIMQYIREQRCKPGYLPNQRHCMLGQDADLIMLGLATHEPHFTLLREVIDFGSGRRFLSSRQTVMKQTKDATFQLLHLSILREYILLEFSSLNSRTFALDTERLIDDFVFLTFLVGNDFLPHLPTLDISEHAFDVVYDAYKKVFTANPGYIVSTGEIESFSRLEEVFRIIGKQESEILRNREIENKRQAKRDRRRNHEVDEEDVEDEDEEVPDLDEVTENELESAVRDLTVTDDDNGTSEDSPVLTKDGKNSAQVKAAAKKGVKDHRLAYYSAKLAIDSSELAADGTTATLEKLKESYLSGLMWCLAYYSKGCVSWTWYFPFHYGPMLIDMTDLTTVASRIKFVLGQPFHPFQQLLGCLPPASAKLLPMAYQWIMLGDHSPVKEFYPTHFEIDMNGKRNPWEAVVLLPFIDEVRLLKAEADYCSPAAAAAVGRPIYASELVRNNFGKMMRVRYAPDAFETVLRPAGCPDIGYPDILNCQTVAEELDFDIKPSHPFAAALIEGTLTPYPGFPSLGMVAFYRAHAEAVKINVFGSYSKYKSLMIELQTNKTPFDVSSIDLSKLLGKTVYVNYPQNVEARVVSVSTVEKEVRCSKEFAKQHNVGVVPESEITTIIKTSKERNEWSYNAQNIQSDYRNGMRVPGSGGIEIGPITMLVGVVTLQGMERDYSTGSRLKVFGSIEAMVPAQLVLWNLPVQCVDPRFNETESLPLQKLMPYGVSVLVTSGHFVGRMGKIVGPHGPDGVIRAPASTESAQSAAENPAVADDFQVQKGKKLVRPSLKKELSLGAKRTNQGYYVDVEFEDVPKEPDFGLFIAQSVREKYYSSREVCQNVGISPNVLGMISCAVLIAVPGNLEVDVGLNLRRNGQYQLLGYVRQAQRDGEDSAVSKVQGRAWNKREDTVRILGSLEIEEEEEDDAQSKKKDKRQQQNGTDKSGGKNNEEERSFWEYSERCIELLQDYVQRYPLLFQQLTSMPYQRKYNHKALFGENGADVVSDIMDWMKKQPFFALPRTPLTTLSLSTEAIAAVEKTVDERKQGKANASNAPIVAQGIPSNMLFRGDLFAPTDISPNLENPSFPMLGMRVVNVTAVAIPFGLKGTVVGIHANTGYVDILFDEDYGSGRPVIGATSKFRGGLVPWSSVLCITSDDAIRNFARQIRSGSHAAFGVPESVIKGGAIRPQPGSKGGKAPSGPAAKSADAKKGPSSAKQGAPTPVVVSKAPESLGAFRIIKRVDDGTTASAPTTNVPTAALKEGKKSKISRKSDGTGLMALAAAATGEDVLAADSSASATEAVAVSVPAAQSENAGKTLLSMLKSSSASGSSSNISASSLKAEGSNAVAAASSTPTADSGNSAGKKLLSFIKNADASNAASVDAPPPPPPAATAEASPAPPASAAASSPALASGASKNKLVPASLMVKMSKK